MTVVTAVLAGPMLAGPAAAAASAPQQWYISSLGFTAAWKASKGAGVTVAVVGAGADPKAADLAGALVPGTDLSGADFASPVTAGTLDATTDLNQAYDGTQVAAVLAGRGKLGVGVVGAAPQASVMPVRIGTNNPYPNAAPERMAAGIRYAVAHGASVVLVPAGWGGAPSQKLADAVALAESRDVVLVAGVGNNGTQGNQATEPSNLPGVIGVGGTDTKNAPWAASTRGNQVAVAAPAAPLRAPTAAGKYTAIYSTHESSALVAGEAALVRAAHPDWTAGQVVRAILDTATGNGTRIDDQVGYGVVNPGKALAAAAPAVAANPLGAVPLPSPSAAASTAAPHTGTGLSAATAPARAAASSGSNAVPIIAGVASGGAILVGAGIVWLLVRRRNQRNYFSDPAYASPPVQPYYPPYDDQGYGGPPDDQP